MRAAKRTKDQAPPDLSGRLAAILRRPTALRDEEAVTGPDARAAAVTALEECLGVVAEASRTVRAAASHVIGAASEPDEGRRALLAERYDDARAQIDRLRDGLPEGAEPLMGDALATLDVPLRGATYAVAPFPLSTDETGLDLPPPADGFASHGEVAATLRRVELALERLARVRAIYEADHAFLSGSLASGV